MAGRIQPPDIRRRTAHAGLGPFAPLDSNVPGWLLTRRPLGRAGGRGRNEIGWRRSCPGGSDGLELGANDFPPLVDHTRLGRPSPRPAPARHPNTVSGAGHRTCAPRRAGADSRRGQSTRLTVTEKSAARPMELNLHSASPRHKTPLPPRIFFCRVCLAANLRGGIAQVHAELSAGAGGGLLLSQPLFIPSSSRPKARPY